MNNNKSSNQRAYQKRMVRNGHKYKELEHLINNITIDPIRFLDQSTIDMKLSNEAVILSYQLKQLKDILNAE